MNTHHLRHPLQLSAGGEDVAAAGFAEEGGEGVAEDRLERVHAFRVGRLVGNAGARVKGDEVDLAAEVGQEADRG